jgi:hypothetical protein
MVTKKCTHLAVALASALVLAASPASADGDAGPVAPVAPVAPRTDELAPAVHHAPISSAAEGEPLTVRAVIDAPHLVKGAHVVYRTAEGWFSVRLMRSGDLDHAAEIPARHVKVVGLAYAIELERADGKREPVFASREEPHPVIVHEDGTDERERWLLDRLGGRRSVVSATGELVRFGTTTGKTALPCAPGQESCPPGESRIPTVDDQYWRVEASYTYRPLRTVAEFGFRLGVVRGRSLVDVDLYDDDRFDVGLNYAGANVRFRIADILHADLQIMGSVTEVGFSTGAGAAVVLGDPYAFHFTLGWQTIGFTYETYFGTRFYTRLDLPVASRITVAPNIEVTDMPHAGDFGVRLLADAGFVLGKGFTLWLRGGYQARISRSGGPAAGATLQFGF